MIVRPEASLPGPRASEPEDIALLRAALRRAEFTADRVPELLGTGDVLARDSAELPLYLRSVPEGEPLATLVRLLVLGVSVPAPDAEGALAPLPLARAAHLGLVRALDGEVAPLVEIVPDDDLLIAADPFGGELSHHDHVPGLSPPARVLAAVTVRREVESALDLGTGQGIHALLAATHARRVTAVDVNPRALRFAAFNVLLNERPEVELLEGDLFAPIAGRRFDLVVSNPPYVISPERRLAYRDSGLGGDAFCEALVRGAPAHLHEGGLAHLLVSWTHQAGEDWSRPLRGWLEGSRCDALLLRLATHDPLTYAAGWNRSLRADPAAYTDALDRWTEHCRRLGIEAISWGAVVLRRRAGRTWTFAYTHAADRLAPAGHHVARLIDAQDLLAAVPADEALLDLKLQLAADHRVDQTGAIEADSLAVERAVLRLEGGLGLRVSLDTGAVRLLAAVDGERPLGAALAAAELPRDAALRIVRRLVELGFLVRATAP
jgi:methylase of polypeptide subunit release factors